MCEHEMVADSMWRLPDNVLRRFFGVKGNSYPAVAALITREKSLLGGQGPFSRWVGNARISASFGIAMVILTNHSLRDTLIGCNGLVTVIWVVTVKDNMGWIFLLRLAMHIGAVFCSDEVFPLHMLSLFLDPSHHSSINFVHNRIFALPDCSFPPQSA